MNRVTLECNENYKTRLIMQKELSKINSDYQNLHLVGITTSNFKSLSYYTVVQYTIIELKTIFKITIEKNNKISYA